jgi:hypothetical protein
MAEHPTKIRITGKVTYEDDITPSQAAQIITFLDSGHGATLGAGERAGARAGGPNVAGPRAALDASGATTNPEKIVALAAYVLQDGGETFKLDAVKVQFQRARETMPKNLSRDLGSAISSGWIEESETRGEYYLTNKVDNLLRDGFGVKAKVTASRTRLRSPSSKPRKTGAAKSTKGAKPDTFAAIDEFPVTMEGFPSYHKMKSNKNKLLWAVRFAKDHDIKGLSVKDIAWLTDQLGHGVPAQQVTAAFGSARKPGYATRSTVDGTIRILPTGEEYLKGLEKSG